MKWQHKKSGGIYEVICTALVEATLEPVIIYRKVDGQGANTVWTRPVNEFMDGRFTPHSEEPLPEVKHPAGASASWHPGDTVILKEPVNETLHIAWAEKGVKSPTDVIESLDENEALLHYRQIFVPLSYLKVVGHVETEAEKDK